MTSLDHLTKRLKYVASRRSCGTSGRPRCSRARYRQKKWRKWITWCWLRTRTRLEWSTSGGESRLSSPRSSFLIARFVNKCSLNITRHSLLSSSRNLTTCHTRDESKLFYCIVMFSPKVCKELDFISLNSASQIIPSVDMRVSCYKELKCRCREVREKVDGQQYIRGVENTSMTDCISSL